jgi:hypothetical protein
MYHGVIASGTEGKITYYRGNAKFIGTKHKSYGNGYKPAECGFTRETGFKKV